MSRSRASVAVAADEPTIPNAVIESAIKRADAKKARAQQQRKKARTPQHKQTHYVGNEDVHVDNDSARQADQVEEIDRDSELPTSWKRSGSLDAPAPRAGYTQRWIRARQGNVDDYDNMQRAIDEGWRPVKRTTTQRVHELTADLSSKFAQYYVRKGQILMELPIALAQQRNKHFAQKRRRMTESVDRSFFKLDNPVMPLLTPERSSLTATRARRGRLEAGVAADDAE